MENKYPFRKSIFGGYNSRVVLDYVNDIILQKDKEIESLKESIETKQKEYKKLSDSIVSIDNLFEGHSGTYEVDKNNYSNIIKLQAAEIDLLIHQVKEVNYQLKEYKEKAQKYDEMTDKIELMISEAKSKAEKIVSVAQENAKKIKSYCQKREDRNSNSLANALLLKSNMSELNAANNKQKSLLKSDTISANEHCEAINEFSESTNMKEIPNTLNIKLLMRRVKNYNNQFKIVPYKLVNRKLYITDRIGFEIVNNNQGYVNEKHSCANKPKLGIKPLENNISKIIHKGDTLNKYIKNDDNIGYHTTM